MRILLVEDNADHRELMRLALTEYDLTWQVEGVVSGEEALRRLAEGEAYDVVFLDYSLPGRDGLEMLAEIRRGEAPPLVVMVTGRGDEQVAVEAMKGGAYDYVVKGEGYRQRLPVVAQRALEAQQLAVDRKRAEEALRQSEERYRAIMEQSADGIYLVDVDTKSIIEANLALARMLGYTQEEMQGMHNYQLVAATPENIDRKFQEIIASPSPLSFERKFRKKDGSLLEVWITAGVLFFAGKRAACGIIKDLTERKRAEEEREQLINELQEALANIKTLRGLIPICASCKKIRDDKGYWQQVDTYVREHTEATFTHGLCPECIKLLFPDLKEKRKGGNPI